MMKFCSGFTGATNTASVFLTGFTPEKNTGFLSAPRTDNPRRMRGLASLALRAKHETLYAVSGVTSIYFLAENHDALDMVNPPSGRAATPLRF